MLLFKFKVNIHPLQGQQQIFVYFAIKMPSKVILFIFLIIFSPENYGKLNFKQFLQD